MRKTVKEKEAVVAETPAVIETEKAVQPAPVKQMLRLTPMMALDEPQRTESLEAFVNSGESVLMRSRTDSEVRVRYGKIVLIVPKTPKPFTPGHAIHLLWTAPNLVEEVAEE